LGEYHPAARKVVLQFSPADIPGLTTQQRLKLLKLVGPRYNPDTEIIKMSCEQFEAPAQNKRYLGDLVKKLLDEARNPEDTFEDIPLDLRHHKPKRRLDFPEAWKMRPERVSQLFEARQEQRLLEAQQATAETRPLDGKVVVQEYARTLARPALVQGTRRL
jgi:small subunit ribosomal protein S35